MLSLETLALLRLSEALKYSAAAYILYYVSWIFYTRFFHPLKNYPGPFLASISNWWFWRSVRYGIAENTQLPLHKKYGPVVRITPNQLSLADASALDVIYGTRPGWRKTDFYESFNPRIGDRIELFSALDDAKHTERRKITASLFTTGAVLRYEPNVDRIVAVFLQRLEDAAASSQSVEMSCSFRQYTLDTIGEIFYGREGGFNMLDTILAPLSSIGYVPKGAQTLYFMSQLLSSSNRCGLRAFATIISDSRAVVKERRQNHEKAYVKKNDMLSRLINIVDETGSKIDFDDEDVAVNVYDAIMAGSDTTGIALTHLFYLIVEDRGVYKKLSTEIRNAFAMGALSSPVRYTDAIKLEYWSACVKEVERFSPIGGIGNPRIIPAGGVKLPGGQYLPGGYQVTMNANVVHFDKCCFGEDAEVFRPERWLDQDSETIKVMERHLIGFGKGPRVCLGKHLAMMKIHKLIPVILENFDFELLNRCTLQNHWFRRRTNVNVKVYEAAKKEIPDRSCMEYFQNLIQKSLGAALCSENSSASAVLLFWQKLRQIQ